MEKKSKHIESLMWSIALPGLGQLLNRKYLKGIVFIFLEFLINIHSNLNFVIVLSFHGEMQRAIQETNYGWLMFYPCIYLFAIWDAYKDAGGGLAPFSFLPFIISAMLCTIGVIYSPLLTIFGVLLGPVFLPILFILLGIGFGILLRKIIIKTLME